MARKRSTSSRPTNDNPHALTVTMRKGATFTGGYYVTMGERFIFQRFDNIVPAYHFLKKMIAGQEFVWDTWSPARGITPEPMIRTALGLTIRGAGLEEALEFEPSDHDLTFVFPEPYSWYDTWPLRGTKDLTAAPAPTTTTTDEPKAPKAPKPVKVERPSKEGLVTVAQICADNKWDPKHARAALRKANIEKPEAGWAFPPSDVARITKAIKDNLK